MSTTTRTVCATVLATLGLTGTASAQFTTVATEGQTIPGVGDITSFQGVSVNDDGEWILNVDTDGIPGIDGVILTTQGVLMQDGEPAVEPVGATYRVFRDGILDNRGLDIVQAELDGTSGCCGLFDDEGIYVGGELLVQRGGVSTAPQFAPGSFWRVLNSFEVNNSDQMLVHGLIDDLGVPGTSQDALVLIDFAPSGQLLSEQLLIRAGDVMPGTGQAAFSLGFAAFNDAGQLMLKVSTDGIGDLQHEIYLDDTLLAQGGTPSPAPGRNWKLASTRLDLNACGQWVFAGGLDGDSASDSMIVKDGEVFVQEGDSPAAIAPHHLTNTLTSTPVAIGDNGAVLWYAAWDGGAINTNEGLFLDKALIVRKGVTQIDGQTVIDLGISYKYALSPYGEWVIFEARLADGNDGIFLWGGGPWKNLGYGLAGTNGTMPCHTATGTLAEGEVVRLVLGSALQGSAAAVVFSLTELSAPFKGGTLVPFPDFVVAGLPVDAEGDVSLATVFPSGVPAGFEIYTQYGVTDPGAPAGFSASNAFSGLTE
jgi:hypothetical protein